MSSQKSGATDPNWWRQACIYQVYPRSFADGNGDGIGDFKGVTKRVKYLKDLGIDAAWFSPFYTSDMKDGGYDVADYRNIDPRIGTLEDFDEMVKALTENGMKTIVDIVPNHCSDKHPWFQEALKAPKGSRERSRFHFLDGKGPNKTEPPNDWESYFGGSAWEPSGANDGQFYLHLYDVSQPEWNWDDKDVREDFLHTLRFWAERGVSGFRIDVALGCVKDMSEPFLPHKRLDEIKTEMRAVGYPPNQHPFRDRDGVLEVYKEWREKVWDTYDPPLMSVAEAWVAPDRRRLYASQDRLRQAFALETLACAYNPSRWQYTIDLLLEESAATGSTPVWVVSNHDFVRHTTRYGIPGVENMVAETTADLSHFPNAYLHSKGKDPACDLELGTKRAKAITLMLMGLPGSMYMYQGEELGLPEVVEIPEESREDPTFFRTHGERIGRDGCRVPLPWTKSPQNNVGFSDIPSSTQGSTAPPTPAWLPMPEWMGRYSVEAEQADESSFLSFYRKAIRIRKELRVTAGEAFEWIKKGTAGEVLEFKRGGGHRVIMNFAKEAVDLPGGEVLITTDVDAGKSGKLGQDHCAWVKLA